MCVRACIVCLHMCACVCECMCKNRYVCMCLCVCVCVCVHMCAYVCVNVWINICNIYIMWVHIYCICVYAYIMFVCVVCAYVQKNVHACTSKTIAKTCKHLLCTLSKHSHNCCAHCDARRPTWSILSISVNKTQESALRKTAHFDFLVFLIFRFF